MGEKSAGKVDNWLEFKFKFKGLEIVVDLPSAVKAKMGIPLKTTKLDLELKIDTKENATFSLKFDKKEQSDSKKSTEQGDGDSNFVPLSIQFSKQVLYGEEQKMNLH